ncbi:MAG: hydroxylamine oxidoreductase [Methanobacteriota archaeon]|nr:MAG: hydroxylamine oxidoreductase [Euryarchaeota archaeon]
MTSKIAFLSKSERHNGHYVRYGATLLLMLFVATAISSVAADPCVDCHRSSNVLEGVSRDWETSRHYQVGTTCLSCHGADATDVDAISHNGYTIAVVVTPNDCAQCHSTQVQEFGQSLHAFGGLYYELLFTGEKLPFLESQIEGGYIIVQDEELIHAATMRGCQSCHGTNMTGSSYQDYKVWPNNGIGRINPDGSMGSCTACHSRHSFSIEEARKPETCGQCHMGPDHPQIEIYMESKHGNIYMSEGDYWNWTDGDWEAGIDYRAPTCASCHMSGAPGAPATHDVSSRLSWELEPALSRHTDNIANGLGVSFSDGTTWEVKRDRMKSVCVQCHSTTWVNNFYQQADVVVELYNEQYTYAKAIVDGLYEDGLLTADAFDEPIEFKIYEMWHHEGRRARMGAFMQGPDYVQWHGFYELLQDTVEIEHMAEELRAAQAPEADDNVWLLQIVVAVLVVELLVLVGLAFRVLSPGNPGKGSEEE